MANLADCYRNLNQMQEAMEWYERAWSTPNDIDVVHHLHYGKVLMANSSYDRAMDQFRRYAQIDEEIGRHFIDKANFAKAQRANRSPYQVQNVGSINTSSAEFGPSFYQDNQMIFSSGRTDGLSASDLRGSGAQNWVFLAEEKPSGLLEPVSMVNLDRKQKYSEGPVSYSADGSLAAITRNNFVDGKRHTSASGMKLDLFFAQVSPDGGWSTVQPFPYNDPEYSTGFAHLAADGNTLYFASDRPDANQIGGFDIYVSFRTGDTWSTPENLGPIINTPGDEITPYFDGRNLYFSSDWHPGLGGYDVFRSEKASGQWSRSMHLGSGVNSARDDYGFIYDGIQNKGYFVSNREQGIGVEDIYSVTQAFEEITLRVVNASDKSPVADATVDFVDCGLSSYTTDAEGVYSFPLQDGMNCRVLIKKNGYLSSAIQLSDTELREQRNFEVDLRREGEDYTGSVIDGISRLPISSVYIRATNQVTGQYVETVADEDGEYTLALSPNAMYIIRYSKAGYMDMNRTLPTGNGADRTILEVFPMQRVDGTQPVAGEEDLSDRVARGPQVPTTPSTTGTTTTTNPDYRTNNGGNVVSRPNTTTGTTNTTTTTTGTPQTGTRVINSTSTSANYGETVYAVQIAADRVINKKEFDHLSNEFGNVYYVQSFDLTKVRVGPYWDKYEAARIQRKLLYRGFKGAFIVTEDGKTIGNVVTTSPDAIAESGSTYAPPTTTAPSTSSSSSGGNYGTIRGGYKIRLGSYVRPRQSFRGDKVSQYGTIEQRKKDKWTIMLLGGFQSAADARAILGRVRAAGFKDAFVVIEEPNGALTKVK